MEKSRLIGVYTEANADASDTETGPNNSSIPPDRRNAVPLDTFDSS